MKSNKSLGNNFESSFCELLSEYGYWSHNMAANASGQPADIIAAKDGKSYLIDCKVCSNGKFSFSRIEENQTYAMKLWEKCGNGQGWFALLLEESVYMIPRSIIEKYSETQSGFNADEIVYYGVPFEIWNGTYESVGAL